METNNYEFIGLDEKNSDQVTKLSTILPGKELTINEFKDWIEQSESKPSISLQEVINKWTNKRIELTESLSQ